MLKKVLNKLTGVLIRLTRVLFRLTGVLNMHVLRPTGAEHVIKLTKMLFRVKKES